MKWWVLGNVVSKIENFCFLKPGEGWKHLIRGDGRRNSVSCTKELQLKII